MGWKPFVVSGMLFVEGRRETERDGGEPTYLEAVPGSPSLAVSAPQPYSRTVASGAKTQCQISSIG